MLQKKKKKRRKLLLMPLFDNKNVNKSSSPPDVGKSF